MKKRFLSLILAFAMLLPLIPAWSISISAAADNANELTEAEAFAAGLDVYVAWYNHRGEDWNTSDHIKSIYEDKNSSFNRLFAQIYPDGPASKGGQKLLGEAKVWLEDHYDGIDQFAQKENEIAMAILLACLLFTAETDVSSDNEIMDLEEFSYQATKNGFSLYNFEFLLKLSHRENKLGLSLLPFIEFYCDFNSSILSARCRRD